MISERKRMRNKFSKSMSEFTALLTKFKWELPPNPDEHFFALCYPVKKPE
jgi:hypothetical protein